MSPTPHSRPMQNEAEHEEEWFADGDSAIGDSRSEYTQAMSVSVAQFPVEHGRRYHALRPGSYAMPNDDLENDRLEVMHEMIFKTLGKRLFLSPIDLSAMGSVLDMGTGTGIWAIEVADKFPNLSVVGNDLSPIQPPWVPSNVKFVIDDIETPWLHRAPFDFVFGRYLLLAIRDWPALVRSAYDNINPGGWIELQDFDITIFCDEGPVDPLISEWVELLVGASQSVQREASPGPKLEGWLNDGGFQAVSCRRIVVPFGTWPEDPALRDIGSIHMGQTLFGLEGFSLRLMCDVLGWTVDEVKAYLERLTKVFLTQRSHLYMYYYVVYGQKPLSS